MNAPDNPLLVLLRLSQQARNASRDELPFMLVNDTFALQPYRQAALWMQGQGVKALSGSLLPEANAPFVLWLEQVFAELQRQNKPAGWVAPDDLPPALVQGWSEWLPAHGLWIPLADIGGVLLLADEAWPEEMLPLLLEWSAVWRHAWLALQTAQPEGGRQWLARLRRWLQPDAARPWWKQPRTLALAAVTLILLLPVRLSVLAPAEIVPIRPEAIRAPLDGVIGRFYVQPNQPVKAGQLLFDFDAAALEARLAVAQQGMETAGAEYRQYASQAIADSKYKAQLAALLGKIEEKRTEVEYLQGQLTRSQVRASRDGVAIVDDPSEWIGRPVQTGERILRIANPAQLEIEAWLPVGDAIPLPGGAPLRLYLAAQPLDSLAASLRYMGYEAKARPDNSYAYRIRATLQGGALPRIGQKGTARIYGHRVPVIYWMLRRPWAIVRQTLGL